MWADLALKALILLFVFNTVSVCSEACNVYLTIVKLALCGIFVGRTRFKHRVTAKFRLNRPSLPNPPPDI